MNKERLLKLADHLEHGKLGHEKFDFEIYNNADNYRCGTNGCAIGECPILFPDDWYFDEEGDPILRNKRHVLPSESGMDYFDLSCDEYYHLFMPTEQNPLFYDGEILGGTATKEQVAANIRAFVAKMERMMQS